MQLKHNIALLLEGRIESIIVGSQAGQPETQYSGESNAKR
jgi:hypothetical protein